MLRVTIEILPGGDVHSRKTIGSIDIANIFTYENDLADYAVAIKKTPPFGNAMFDAYEAYKIDYEKGYLRYVEEYDGPDLTTGKVKKHNRIKESAYTLLRKSLQNLGY